ncbi:MAG: hypothetical protein Q9217_003678 [Psora testacea]
MCLVFVIGFPLGAFLIRLCSFRGLVWIHAGVQILAYLGALLGLALGIYIGIKGGKLGVFHPILGIIIVVLLLPQPVLGYFHHLQYNRHQHATIYTTAHIWYGRVFLTLGLINGYLGLRLNRQETGTKVAYVVIAGIIWLAWVGLLVRGLRRDKAGKRQRNEIRMATLQQEAADGHFEGPPRRF